MIQWEEIQVAFKTVSEKLGDKGSLGKKIPQLGRSRETKQFIDLTSWR